MPFVKRQKMLHRSSARIDSEWPTVRERRFHYRLASPTSPTTLFAAAGSERAATGSERASPAHACAAAGSEQSAAATTSACGTGGTGSAVEEGTAEDAQRRVQQQVQRAQELDGLIVKKN